MIWSADFETTTDVNDCRVWAWCVCEVGDIDNMFYGNNIESFIEFMRINQGEYYFHNLAFDGEFILHYLLNNGFTYSDKAQTNTFKTLISAMGKFYQIDICFKKNGKKKKQHAVLKDSLKKLPMKVSAIAKSFNLPISKLEIDYKQYRPIGHELTQEEKEYIKNDVQIVALALEHQFKEGLNRLTIGSDALNIYKYTNIGENRWKKFFPILTIEMDALIRQSYKGGWTYANPKYQNKIQGAGSVYDVNSLYPDVMYNRPLPYGVPVYYHGKYKPNNEYPLFIQFITCSCKLKEGYLPILQIKNSPFYSQTEYLTETDIVDLALTSVDYELLFMHYDVTVFGYKGGFMFKQATGLFDEYIDYWSEIKANNKGGKRQIAKLMLNSLYGKFATNPDVTPKLPYLKEENCVGYKLGKQELRQPIYTPIGCFITAWARFKTITTAQSVYNRFMYADTDSIHVLGTQPVENIEVHPTRLGAWKHESNFSRALYIRAKAYMEEITQEGEMVNGEYVMVDVDPYKDVKCAGLPQELKKFVTFENFKSGLCIEGKLRPVHCEGGIVLKETTFTMK